MSACEVCHNEYAQWVMYPTHTDSRDTASYPVLMCEDCAMDAVESGEYETSGDDQLDCTVAR